MFRYVTAQVTNQKELDLRLLSMSDTIIKPLCKVALYINDHSSDANGWIESASSALSRASKYEVQSSVDGKFYEMSLFASFPISAADSEGILEDWNQELNRIGYPVKSNSYIHDMGEPFYKVCSELVSISIDIFLSKNHYRNMKYFNKTIRTLFLKNGFVIN